MCKNGERNFIKKGIFITFEGPEGSGKTTQIALLDEYLRECGYKVVRTREPGGTFIGDKIRKVLLDCENEQMEVTTEIFLYEAVRVEHVEKKIRPALAQENTFVLCDRFFDSTLAYQGYGRGWNIEEIKICNQIAINGVIPDLTFLLDIDPELGLERVKGRGLFDRIEQEDILFHKKVREGFLKIAEENRERFIIVDAAKRAEDIHQEIISEVKRRFLSG